MRRSRLWRREHDCALLRARRPRSLALKAGASCSRQQASRTPQSSSLRRAACTQRASTRSTTRSPTRGLSAERLPLRVRDKRTRGAAGLDVARRRSARLSARSSRRPCSARAVYMRCPRRPSLLSRRICRNDPQALSDADAGRERGEHAARAGADVRAGKHGKVGGATCITNRGRERRIYAAPQARRTLSAASCRTS
jgi:hypothetical protein